MHNKNNQTSVMKDTSEIQKKNWSNYEFMWVFIKFFVIDNMNWTMCFQFKEESKVYIFNICIWFGNARFENVILEISKWRWFIFCLIFFLRLFFWKIMCLKQ